MKGKIALSVRAVLFITLNGCSYKTSRKGETVTATDRLEGSGE